jgi:Asp-tRNA(Asn)/Glu-tRNA(Gln) amidotransferase C subunit
MLKEDVVEKVAQLARLKLTEEEKETIGKQLMSILEFVNQLNEVSTEGVDAVWDGQEGTHSEGGCAKKGVFPRESFGERTREGRWLFCGAQNT